MLESEEPRQPGIVDISPTYVYNHISLSLSLPFTFTPFHLHPLPPSLPSTFTPFHLHSLPPSLPSTFTPFHLHSLPPSLPSTFTPFHLHFSSLHLLTFIPTYGSNPTYDSTHYSTPFLPFRCIDVATRVAAYDLLVELCTGCYENLSMVAKQLINMHHKPDHQLVKEWEVCEEWVWQVLTPPITVYFSIVSASCGWEESLRLCGLEECWCHLLHELCTPATLHDLSYKRGGCVLLGDYIFNWCTLFKVILSSELEKDDETYVTLLL